jgi:hypothetical protein
MGSDHHFHPEFGWLAPTSRFRRELRIGFFSMLFGLSIGAMAVSALSGVGSRNAGTNSESRVAAPDVVAPSITEASPNGADNKRREASSIKIDPSNPITKDTDGLQRDSGRANAGNACDGNKAGCLENTRRASERPAANHEPAIARIPLGRAEALTGMIQGSGRTEVAAQGSIAPERTTPPTLEQDVARIDRPNSRAISRVGRSDVRGSSSSPPGFWDWSR